MKKSIHVVVTTPRMRAGAGAKDEIRRARRTKKLCQEWFDHVWCDAVKAVVGLADLFDIKDNMSAAALLGEVERMLDDGNDLVRHKFASKFAAETVTLEERMFLVEQESKDADTPIPLLLTKAAPPLPGAAMLAG